MPNIWMRTGGMDLKTSAILILIGLCFGAFFGMTGCGSDPELDYYKENMNIFFENVALYDKSINEIDPASDEAVTELLSHLDSMSASFSQMAELTVPQAFIGVEQLADEADNYMKEAVSLYHQAFEAEIFDENIEEAAQENYSRANLRIQYIISILHGDIPEEIITYEETPAADES